MKKLVVAVFALALLAACSSEPSKPTEPRKAASEGARAYYRVESRSTSVTSPLGGGRRTLSPSASNRQLTGDPKAATASRWSLACQLCLGRTPLFQPYDLGQWRH